MSTENRETNQFTINSKKIDNDHKKLLEEKKVIQQLIHNFNKEIKTLEKELKSIVAIKALAKEQMDKKKEIVRKLSQDIRELEKSKDELVNNLENVQLTLNKEKGDTAQNLQYILEMNNKERIKEGKKMINDFRSQYKPSYFSQLYNYVTGKRRTGITSRRVAPHNNTLDVNNRQPHNNTQRLSSLNSVPKPKILLFENGINKPMPMSMSNSELLGLLRRPKSMRKSNRKVVRLSSRTKSKKNRRPSSRGIYPRRPSPKQSLKISNIARSIRESNNMAPNFHQKLSRTLSEPKRLEKSNFTFKSRSNNPILRNHNNSFLFGKEKTD